MDVDVSADGLDHARRLGATLRAVVADTTVVSSTEPKAIETAEALGLGAVHRDQAPARGQPPWDDDQQALPTHAVGQYLSGLPVAGWESLDDAVARFSVPPSGSRWRLHRGLARNRAVGVAQPTGLALDAADFWNQLEMPDAWRVDLGARTLHRVDVGDAPWQR